MKHFKKLLILLFAVLSITCFVLGCGGDSSSNSSSNNQISSSQSETQSSLLTQNSSSSVSSSSQKSISSSSISVSVKPGNISFNTLYVNGTEISGEVANNVLEYDFLQEITITGNIDFILSKDINGNNTLLDKKAPLLEGENTFYVIETDGLVEYKVYIVNIYRRKMFTLQFDTDGGTPIEEIRVEENSIINAPQTEKMGYDFVGWSFNFLYPITQSQTIMAFWQARTDTSYKVEYYLQNIENFSEYKIEESLTEQLFGETDTIVYAQIKNIDGYEVVEENVRGNVQADGRLILKVYYDIIRIFSVNYLGYIDGYYDYATNFSNVTIPSKINNKEIVGISSNAFKNWTTLESITFPNTIKTIESYAFRNCSGLKNIDLGNSVETIGSCAFIDCSLISNYNIPTSVKKVDSFAFKGNTNLERIIIPSSVTELGTELFDGCSNLQELTIPFIGGSESETTATATTLFGNLFGRNVFEGATETKQYYRTNGSVKYYLPKSLKSVTVTGGKIMYGAFYNCANIENIILGEGVGIIGDRAFYNCTSLNNFTITKNVKQIGIGAFENCSKLSSLSFENTNGWFVTQDATATSGMSISVTDLLNNATNLKSTYSSYYWKQSV